MNNLSYKQYFNKVYGCWLGKSIAGTIGAPFEGRKELFNYEFDPRSLDLTIPNDDLDIQVIWLDVLEHKGIYPTALDLAESFAEKYPFSPGEYAYFKKNHARGIEPPISGRFNNTYYYNGMGCPIRSEIWACTCAGNPLLAKEFAILDGCLDHGENSIDGEIFFATLESLAFFKSDIKALIYEALTFIDNTSPLYNLITDVIGWCESYTNPSEVRALILEHWGHADCTNLFQNIGISVMALLTGDGDFTKTVMNALNCGYDTDCTCATVGSVLGIIKGADALLEAGYADTGYVLDAKVTRRSDKLYDLAEDTCIAGLMMAKYRNLELIIEDAPNFNELPSTTQIKPIMFEVDYNGIPSLAPNEKRTVSVTIHNTTASSMELCLSCDVPNGWEVVMATSAIVKPFQKIKLPIEITARARGGLFAERNIVTVHANDVAFSFGIAGAQAWKVYGPFWRHHSSIPQIPYWERYDKYFNNVDDLREYHLSAYADVEHPYVDETDFDHIEDTPWNTCSLIPKHAFLHEDCFHLSDYITYQGSYTAYFIREFVSSEDKTCVINVGHSSPFKLWLNGELVLSSTECKWWTAENLHSETLNLKKGVNKLVLKATKIGQNDTFNIYLNDGLFTNHHFDYISVVD